MRNETFENLCTGILGTLRPLFKERIKFDKMEDDSLFFPHDNFNQRQRYG